MRHRPRDTAHYRQQQFPILRLAAGLASILPLAQKAVHSFLGRRHLRTRKATTVLLTPTDEDDVVE